MFSKDDYIEFNKIRESESLGNYTSGARGFILETDDEGKYEILVGEVIILGVPEEDIFTPSLSVDEKVDVRIKKAQLKKKFKDTGSIGGSAKEKRAYSKILMGDLQTIEKDSILARELVTKERTFPKWNLEEQKEKGVTGGAAFLKVKMRESMAAKPANDVNKRKIYVGYIDYLVKTFTDIKTVSEFKTAARNLSESVIEEIIKIVIPEKIGEIEKEVQDNIVLQQKYESLYEEADKKKYDELDRLKKKHNGFYNAPTEEEKEEYEKLNRESDELRRKKNELLHRKPIAVGAFIENLGLSNVSTVSSYSAIGRSLLNTIFGKTFYNFIVQASKSAKDNYELAESYEPFTEEQAANAITRETLYETQRLVQNEEKLKILNEAIAKNEKEGLDEVLKDTGYGFYKSNFDHKKPERSSSKRGGSDYWYYSDIKTEEHYRIYAQQYAEALKRLIEKSKIKIAETIAEYKPRINDYGWAESKGTKYVKSTKLKINTYPPLEYIKRTGGLKIDEKDVTVAFIREKFGFKDVEFGQSLSDEYAREHIRHFLGSVADMADVLNMNLIQLNELGGLSIAFASRGHGKASAHYEPVRKVINITKTRGGGAVFHEYTHYLDNTLAGGGSDSWVSASTEQKESRFYNPTNKHNVDNVVYNKFIDIFKYIYHGTGEYVETKTVIYSQSKKSWSDTFPKETREENIEDFVKSMQATYSRYKYYERFTKNDFDFFGWIAKEYGYTSYAFPFLIKGTHYYNNSKAMGKYWQEEWELFARAGETYMADKLIKLGRYNNYLVSGSLFDDVSGVYPAGKERKDLFEKYDALMASIKEQYNISDFTAWTTERVDEYMKLSETTYSEDIDEEELGVIKDEETGEVEIIGSEHSIEKTSAEKKLNELIEILTMEELEKRFADGGMVGNDICECLVHHLENQKELV